MCSKDHSYCLNLIVYPYFEKSLEELEGEIKCLVNFFLTSLLACTTFVNQTLLGQNQTKPHCLYNSLNTVSSRSFFNVTEFLDTSLDCDKFFFVACQELPAGSC